MVIDNKHYQAKLLCYAMRYGAGNFFQFQKTRRIAQAFACFLDSVQTDYKTRF